MKTCTCAVLLLPRSPQCTQFAGKARRKEVTDVCTAQDYSQRGCGIALNCLSSGFGKRLLDVIGVVKSDVFDVVIGGDTSVEDKDKVWLITFTIVSFTNS